MHTTMKVIVVLVILLVAAIVLIGLMMGWTGQSQNIIQDMFGFFNDMLSGLGGN